jgi:hypothetical protein
MVPEISGQSVILNKNETSRIEYSELCVNSRKECSESNATGRIQASNEIENSASLQPNVLSLMDLKDSYPCKDSNNSIASKTTKPKLNKVGKNARKRLINFEGWNKQIEVSKSSEGIDTPRLCIRTSSGKVLRSIVELQQHFEHLKKINILPETKNDILSNYESFYQFACALDFNDQIPSKSKRLSNLKPTKCGSTKNQPTKRHNSKASLREQKYNHLEAKEMPQYSFSSQETTVKTTQRGSSSESSNLKAQSLKQKYFSKRKIDHVIPCAYEGCKKKFGSLSHYKNHIAQCHVRKQLYHQAQQMARKETCTWCDRKIKIKKSSDVYSLALHIGATHNQILAYVIPEVNRQILSLVNKQRNASNLKRVN